ncbi:hypothetical protein HD599_001181 [Conyzicola lurida]|uniref:Ig-like domain-containing protein n=1 Tax=Conyzicola lurida TaxID=1172621 RepID=A0A841AKI8_9MICO|nr:hypothetical protein [Conyzicola lurida]MBB5842858.1 hypothetical protein [Conyzicola lurida]
MRITPIVLAAGMLLLTGCTSPTSAMLAAPTARPTATAEEDWTEPLPPGDEIALGLTLLAAQRSCDTGGVMNYEKYEMHWDDDASTAEAVGETVVLTYDATVVDGIGAPTRDVIIECTISETVPGQHGAFDIWSKEI